MDINGVLNIILPIVFILLGVALIFFVIELIKTLRATQETMNNIQPTLKNVEDITTNIQPTLAKIDPMMDRVQLTVDSVNLEMMRVDQILENVAEITDSASSATAAVDNITNAPIKAVNSFASRMRSKFGGKDASEESTQLAEQRVAVAQALEDYRAAEEKDAKKAHKAGVDGEAVDEAATTGEFDPIPDADAAPKSYVKIEEDAELVIDPNVIADSPFFDEGPDAK